MASKEPPAIQRPVFHRDDTTTLAVILRAFVVYEIRDSAQIARRFSGRFLSGAHSG